MIKFCFMLNVVEKRNLWQEFIIILCDLTLGQTKLMSMNVVKIKNNRSKGNHDRQFLLCFTSSGFRDEENWCNVIFLNQIMLSHIVMRRVREFETRAQPGIKELNFSRETLTGFQLNAQCCCLREKCVRFCSYTETIIKEPRMPRPLKNLCNMLWKSGTKQISDSSPLFLFFKIRNLSFFIHKGN